MKLNFLLLTCCILWQVNAQLPDSVAFEQTIDSLTKLTRNCILHQDFEHGLAIITRASNMALERNGRISDAYRRCCYMRGKLFLQKGDYLESEKWQLECNFIIDSIFGEEHLDYVWSLDELGQLYGAMGKFEKAEPFHFKAISLVEKIKGKNHTDYAWCINDLAILYRNMGSYEKAEPLYLEAKTIWENALGKEDPDYAWSLNNLANLYYFMGSFEKAEPYYLTAISIWYKLYGEESPNYASGLNNLAALYYSMGSLQKAESLFIKSCKLREKLIGKDNPDYAGSLNNLAGLYMEIGSFEKAESLYLESKSIREKIFGKEHPEYANSVGNLGILYTRTRKNEKAETYLLETKSIWEKLLDLDHPEYASSLFNLANFYSDLGLFEKAELLYIRAMDIRQKMLGIEHPDVSECQRNLAKLYVKMYKTHEAVPFLESSTKQRKAQLLKATSFLSEFELSQYIYAFQNQSDELGAYLYSYPKSEINSDLTNLSALAYDHSLFYKGFLITSAIKLKKLSESTAESKTIYLQLKSYRRRLANEYTIPLKDRTSVKELEDNINLLEKQLAQSVSGYTEASKQVHWKEVQNSLKKNEAAIEFIHFDVNFPNVTDSTLYVALLLKNDSKHVVLIPLFEKKSLDSLLYSQSIRKADYVNSMYTLVNRGAIELENSNRTLYDILWKKLETELIGVHTIYFSPSGLLHRINLNAIPISETETLADKYQLIEVNSTRQLVLSNQIKNGMNDAILYGGINFEADSSFKNNEQNITFSTRAEESYNEDDELPERGRNWNYLAGTDREVNSIEKILKVSGIKSTLKKGYNASEESFKNIGTNNYPSPSILHIATHGYFFPDANTNRHDSVVNSQSESVFKMSDHPMLRSGLIMSGANASWQGKQTLEGREDGILTAFEISQMNLSNTELVVLSACETGLGDIQGNEGVYGLQRAFKIAGVKYIIMSLWQVPDKQTSLLMTAFYKKWLENKMTIPEAFHAAQKELRDLGLDPYQWAGFLLLE